MGCYTVQWYPNDILCNMSALTGVKFIYSTFCCKLAKKMKMQFDFTAETERLGMKSSCSEQKSAAGFDKMILPPSPIWT